MSNIATTASILLCKSENNMNINNNSIFQVSSNHLKEIEPETIRLKREEGGGIIIQAMSQPQQMQNIQHQFIESRPMDHDEKKMRRQIANSNERRRMQSINAGFQTLRQLLPHHEGEKLSKAAILQQTAEYIDRLELEKSQLGAQNHHLQRLVDSLGGNNNNNNNNDCPQQQIIQQTITSSPSTGGAIKKRKLDQVMTVQTISDSSDEGLGSMSPEPVSQMMFSNGASTITKTHMVSATSVTTINVKDYVNLQNQMETERRHRIQLEEQLKQLEMQFYSSHQAPTQKYHQLQNQDEVDEVDGQVVEEKIVLRQAGQDDIHYIGTVPLHPQFVVVSTSTPGSSPNHVIINDDDDNSRTLSSDELHKDEVKMVRHKMSPSHHQQQQQPQQREIRIPSILEQAIKAEPKVEVERINSPSIQINMIEEAAVQSPPRNNSPPSVNIRTTYPNNNQRPNLETIVEAIRHLEGDAFDMDDGQEQTTKLHQAQQDAPLALTTTNKYQQNGVKDPQPFLKFRHNATSQSGLPTFSLSVPSQQQQQYQRPGVIVVKQSS